MVFEKIQEIIAEELGKETEEIKLTTDIQEDLEADLRRKTNCIIIKIRLGAGTFPEIGMSRPF